MSRLGVQCDVTSLPSCYVLSLELAVWGHAPPYPRALGRYLASRDLLQLWGKTSSYNIALKQTTTGNARIQTKLFAKSKNVPKWNFVPMNQKSNSIVQAPLFTPHRSLPTASPENASDVIMLQIILPELGASDPILIPSIVFQCVL